MNEENLTASNRGCLGKATGLAAGLGRPPSQQPCLGKETYARGTKQDTKEDKKTKEE